MFNIFQGIAPYRALLGEDRVAFGYPNMSAFLVDERLRLRVDPPGIVTTVSNTVLAKLFWDAGMPSKQEEARALIATMLSFAPDRTRQCVPYAPELVCSHDNDVPVKQCIRTNDLYMIIIYDH